MRSICLVMLGVALGVAAADSVLRVAEQVSFSNRYGMSPLMKRAAVVHRVRRQTGVLLGPRKPEQCVLDCVETMDEKLTEAFPEAAKNGSTNSVSNIILEGDYDQEKFEKFCDIYAPSSRCLRQCPENNLRTFTEKGLAMVEYMCVTRYADFKKYGKCMDKAGKEIDEVCAKQCSAYESGLQKLENLTTYSNIKDYDEADISDMLNQSCSYVACLMDCDRPLMIEKCGNESADLERDTIKIAFSSLSDLLSEASSDFWPQACDNLARSGHGSGSSSSTSDEDEKADSLSRAMARDGGED